MTRPAPCPAPCSAHVQTFEPPLATTAQGPLAGLRIAVKDNFDIAGHVTGAGHPDWAETHPAATDTAPVVQGLLEAGAIITGKTHMDELAYGLMGQNAHFGTPVNPATPDRMPGGSSSGSASAVAAGMADAGLGTDTGGSIRIPASLCGLWGWRPTHGLLNADGLLPLAPSYDVPGFLTRDADTLRRIAQQFCPEQDSGAPALRCPEDLWGIVPAETAAALRPWRQGDPAPLFDDAMFGQLLPTFRVCQGVEVAAQFGDWIRATEPRFGPGVRERFAGAMAIPTATRQTAETARQNIASHVLNSLGPHGVLILPTAPGAAPMLDCDGDAMERYRNAALTLMSVAGHVGLPQISVPVTTLDGAPLGLSFVGARGTDLTLIDLAVALTGHPIAKTA